MVSIVCLNVCKLMNKLSIGITDVSFCRAQKTALNYTIRSHARFAKAKIPGSFGRSKSDMPLKLFVLRKSAFAFNKKQTK